MIRRRCIDYCLVKNAPDFQVRRADGLARASFLRTWHSKPLSHYVMLLRQGRKLQKPRKGSDLSQLSADFVADADGRVAFARYNERPDDRPAAADVVRAVIGLD